MKRTIKVGYVIKNSKGNYLGHLSDFYKDSADLFLDKFHAQDILREIKRFDDGLKLVTVVMCEIES